MIPILSKSQETKYRQKCKDLKRRIQEIEDFNEATALNLARTKRTIIRVRLERELLMEKLEELAKGDAAEGSDSTDEEVEIGLTELQRALLLRANDPPANPRVVSNNKASQAGTAAALAAIASVQGKGTTNDEDNENGNGGDGSESPKKRAVRNPDMPKRPQNAYIIFCEREKEGVRASMELEADGETFDLTRALADSWKELGQEGRQPYYKLYQDDRRRYLEEMSEYVPENPSEAEQKEIQRAIKALEELKSGKGGDDEEEEAATSTVATKEDKQEKEGEKKEQSTEESKTKVTQPKAAVPKAAEIQTEASNTAESNTEASKTEVSKVKEEPQEPDQISRKDTEPKDVEMTDASEVAKPDAESAAFNKEDEPVSAAPVEPAPVSVASETDKKEEERKD
ncbi:hypothetical protein LXG23DRAFT_55815 [Yarrowia lipolytica]|uniref:HMG box domain-containing protein n=1 Tax=Yarrowia lipolytica TaxID=4952 RepID=A0A1D8NF44_YARLL|nr:hypothetical protein YALI1_D22342g [Yarrowia lipolytica]KAB8281194.1 hypothetical protein BKA91DRAFT_140683 [Yarrowia lipolytica]KAE8170706.1 hypothetical protein BKA90DRAFT_140300 [Yarrowia lipolytica]KAJ8054251.1 hypothetical protein LXG23DRAFT_55815 [Yarrowia lipolytica]RMI97236.1 hypothetical protein BD777DRAFT_126929 [Yarrowia lipolytica]